MTKKRFYEISKKAWLWTRIVFVMLKAAPRIYAHAKAEKEKR